MSRPTPGRCGCDVWGRWKRRSRFLPRGTPMKAHRLLVVLTVFNVLVLAVSLSQTRTVLADGPAPVLRGRALEIVDDRGRVRASISVLPEDPDFKMPDGTRGYPETVLL